MTKIVRKNYTQVRSNTSIGFFSFLEKIVRSHSRDLGLFESLQKVLFGTLTIRIVLVGEFIVFTQGSVFAQLIF